PQDRYATAQDLADDLERWLKNEPIRARRPTLLRRATKWARRHKAVVGAAATVFLLTALVGSANALWWLQKRSGAEGEARALLREATRLHRQEKWPEGLSAVHHARGVLTGIGADPNLWQQVEELGKDLEMVRRLEEANLKAAITKDGHDDWDASDAAYAG